MFTFWTNQCYNAFWDHRCNRVEYIHVECNGKGTVPDRIHERVDWRRGRHSDIAVFGYQLVQSIVNKLGFVFGCQ